MTDKTKSKTFQQIIEEQNINNILDKPNISLKKRHDGLTIKFHNDIINDNTKNKEVAIQSSSTTEEKIFINLKKYSYNSLTIFEDKKIEKLRKKIFNLKIKLNYLSKKEKYLIKIIEQNNEELKIKNNEINKLINELIDIKLQINLTNESNIDIFHKNFFLKSKINNLKKENLLIKEENNNLLKENNNIKIKNFDFNINKKLKKLSKYMKKRKIPTNYFNSWNKEQEKIEKLHKKVNSITNEKKIYKIRKKILKIEKKMIKLWNDKKIEKIYEEILLINNKIYFITTFVHFDNSITEEVLYFQHFQSDDIEIIKQLKQYKNINEYRKDTILIEDILINKNNANIKAIPIKNFLKQQQDFKLRPTITENSLWITNNIFLPIMGVFNSIFIYGGIAILIRNFTLLCCPSTKKVEPWWNNKIYQNKNDENIDMLINNITDDEFKIKLEVQFKILKEELNNRKYLNSKTLLNLIKKIENINFKKETTQLFNKKKEVINIDKDLINDELLHNESDSLLKSNNFKYNSKKFSQ